MLHNSYVFVLAFLPAVLLLWWLPGQRPRPRLVMLTAASYLFYGWWDWRFCGLLLASTLVDYLAGERIARSSGARRTAWLVTSLAVNLGFLAVFKYGGFFAETVNSVSTWWGAGGVMRVPAIVLPVGISFYTFQSMSYSIDIYRGVSRPADGIWHFAAYVSMFPQLVAGPIVRYNELEDQLRDIPVRVDWTRAYRGVVYFVLGMVQKVLVADTIAAAIDPQLAAYQGLGLLGSWYCMLGYACQIYFDFAGYSNMAIGLGLMLGLELPENFDSPYKARNVSDFWRRWHISLSTWLRDYLYVSVGGSRGGRWLTVRNLALVMFLGGLWHGAAWTFVLWGLYHGLLLIVYHVGRSAGLPRFPAAVAVPATFASVVFGWVLFRSDSMAMVGSLTRAMAGLEGVGTATLSAVGPLAVAELVAALVVVFAFPNVREVEPRFRPVAGHAVALAGLMAVCVLRFADPSPFLYFQF